MCILSSLIPSEKKCLRTKSRVIKHHGRASRLTGGFIAWLDEGPFHTALIIWAATNCLAIRLTGLHTQVGSSYASVIQSCRAVSDTVLTNSTQTRLCTFVVLLLSRLLVYNLETHCICFKDKKTTLTSQRHFVQLASAATG